MLLLLLVACGSGVETLPPDSAPVTERFAVPRFDLADGLESKDLGRGVSVLDVDGDGLLDLLSASSNLSFPGGSSVQLHLQNPDGSYRRVTEEWGLRSQMDVWGLVPLDHDNDGELEILMTGAAWNGVTNNLWLTLRPEGPAMESGPYGACGPGATMGASVADLNRDGHLDLVMANGAAHRWGGCTDILLGSEQGLSRLTNVGRGSEEGFGTVVHDLSGDGYPEIVLTEGIGVVIYENLGEPPWFEMDDPAHRYSLRIRAEEDDAAWTKASLAVLLLDYDQDGDLDPFVCTYDDPDAPGESYNQRLLRNDGDMVFTDVSQEQGVRFGPGCMGAGVGDIDMNGYPDLYLGTGGPEAGHETDNILYLNTGDGFVDVSQEAGTTWKGRTHGIEFADMNQDGAMDLILNSGGAYAGQDEGLRVALQRGGPFNGVPVVIKGPANNPDGVGARVVAETDKGTFYAYNLRGSGFGSTNLGPVWVGVADASTATVRVEFPDGAVTTSQELSLPVEPITLRWGD
ncbi:MAG: CRTAC1 family protein [Myxococcota bacterium]|nr:CRTAC1 family protein [Myxococcota bacterium]